MQDTGHDGGRNNKTINGDGLNGKWWRLREKEEKRKQIQLGNIWMKDDGMKMD